MALAGLLSSSMQAQISSGSNGSDGVFNPSNSITIDMHDHPNGVYQYTSVNIPGNVSVTFIPNASNTPVIWLVQSNCTISGAVYASGQDVPNGSTVGGSGGPGGWAGGSGGNNPTYGFGPGSGTAGQGGSGASFATSGGTPGCGLNIPAGPIYGNKFCLPLVGGSGGGGGTGYGCNYSSVGAGGGGGGGGAILIAANGTIAITGQIIAVGGQGSQAGGSGSGGAIRLFANAISGTGTILAYGGYGAMRGGDGWIRFDTFNNSFAGNILGSFSLGFQPIIIPAPGQGVQLSVSTIGGVAVSANPSGQLVTPDAILSGEQTNPVPVVVNCVNLPLNTPITVSVKPVNGSTVSAIGYNNSGTQSSSTATVSINMPRGGGIIYATASTGN